MIDPVLLNIRSGTSVTTPQFDREHPDIIEFAVLKEKYQAAMLRIAQLESQLHQLKEI